MLENTISYFRALNMQYELKDFLIYFQMTKYVERATLIPRVLVAQSMEFI